MARTQHIQVLVCSLEVVEVGVNLEEACEIFFVDSSLDDTQYEQALGRISRYGVKHDRLVATSVCVANTISEQISEYHSKRRDGVSIKKATEVFGDDDPHDRSPLTDVYRVETIQFHMSNVCVNFKTADSHLVNTLFSKDFEDIDAAFEQAFEKQDLMHPTEKEVTLTFSTVSMR